MKIMVALFIIFILNLTNKIILFYILNLFYIINIPLTIER